MEKLIVLVIGGNHEIIDFISIERKELLNKINKTIELKKERLNELLNNINETNERVNLIKEEINNLEANLIKI